MHRAWKYNIAVIVLPRYDAPMKTISLKLPDELDRKLTATVKQRGVAKSDVVREALAHYLADAQAARGGSLLALAADLAGCVDDAAPDTSTNPRYLEDFGR